MATNFPGSLDSFTNPSSSSTLDSPSHAAQHSNVNDAVEALQAKVGVDGSAVTSSLDYQRGLVHIDTFSGTGVTAANFDDVFTADFTAYRVVARIRGMGTIMNMRLRVSGSDYTGTSYHWVNHGLSSTGAALALNGSADSLFKLLHTNISSSSARQGCVFDIIYPQFADFTTLMGVAQSYNTGGNYWTYNIGGTLTTTTAYNGFTLFVSSGTISHTTSIYGYNNG